MEEEKAKLWENIEVLQERFKEENLNHEYGYPKIKNESN